MFLIYTIPQLQPNSADISKDILLHISLQLSNSSVPPFVEPQFFVSPNVIAVNSLLFAGLALVLVDAYLAMVSRSWLRDFDRSWRSSNVPEEHARKREMRIQAMETTLGNSSPPSPDSSLASPFLCCPPYNVVRSLSPHCLFSPRHHHSRHLLFPLHDSGPCTRHERPFHVPCLQRVTNTHECSLVSFSILSHSTSRLLSVSHALV